MSIDPMKVWLITVGEPWPTDGDHPRLLRTGINAGFLAARGHDVTFWTTTYDRALRVERTGQDVDFQTAQGYRLIGLHAGRYERNISLERIKYHRAVAKKFRELALRRPRPNIIVVSLTPLELARAAVEYGRRENIPVVVDIRDMWPDIWAEQLPAGLRSLKKLVFAPFYNDLKRSVEGATAVIGITDSAIDWALGHSRRQRSRFEQAFPLVYPAEHPAEDKVEEATKFWHSLGVGTAQNEIIGCFFGTFTRRVDFETPLKALSEMPSSLRGHFKLVLCGRGEMEPLIKEYAARTPQIICAGWVDAPKIKALMQLSKFGLLPYRPTLDFTRSLPNKVFEYLSSGLPIVTSLRGEIETLFRKYPCGALYQSEDPASFSKLMTAYYEAPETLTRLSLQARAAGDSYDPAITCLNFESYLTELLRATRSSRGKASHKS